MNKLRGIFFFACALVPFFANAEMKPTPLQVTLMPEFRGEITKDTDLKKFELDQIRDFSTVEDSLRAHGWKVTITTEPASRKAVYRRAKGETVDQVVYKLVDQGVCSRAECRAMLSGMNRGKLWDDVKNEFDLMVMLPVRMQRISIDAGSDYQEETVVNTLTELKTEAMISPELQAVLSSVKDRAKIPSSSKNCAAEKCETFVLKVKSGTAARREGKFGAGAVGH